MWVKTETHRRTHPHTELESKRPNNAVDVPLIALAAYSKFTATVGVNEFVFVLFCAGINMTTV